MADWDPVERLEDKGIGESLSVPERIEKLVCQQLYGVLCTQGRGQPYGSVIAFAFSKQLTDAVFATATTTRKYRLLLESPRVALVIDSRTEFPTDLHRIEAITVTGHATELEPGDDYSRWAELLIQRHNQLKQFVASETTALFRIEVTRFLHVTRFQEVRQWIPPLDS